MIIKISRDLKKQEIWANGVELAGIMGKDRKKGKRIITYPLTKKQFVYSFKNPVLLTDNYRISKLSPARRDTLFALYTSMPRIVEYCGVRVFWNNHDHIGVWCPSIDTILFAKALNKVFRERKNFASGAEIGCGSGFLSEYVLKKSRVKSMLIDDLNPYAIKCAMDNIKDKRASFHVGDGIKKIQEQKYDLLICNPPYVPRHDSIDENPYEGISLLNHLVHEGQKYLNKGGVMITNVSSLCEKLIFKEKPIMKMKLLEKMRVPLKVNNILNNKKWMKYLKKHGLKKEYKNGYEYWHNINIIMLKNEQRKYQ